MSSTNATKPVRFHEEFLPIRLVQSGLLAESDLSKLSAASYHTRHYSAHSLPTSNLVSIQEASILNCQSHDLKRVGVPVKRLSTT